MRIDGLLYTAAFYSTQDSKEYQQSEQYRQRNYQPKPLIVSYMLESQCHIMPVRHMWVPPEHKSVI